MVKSCFLKEGKGASTSPVLDPFPPRRVVSSCHSCPKGSWEAEFREAQKAVANSRIREEARKVSRWLCPPSFLTFLRAGCQKLRTDVEQRVVVVNVCGPQRMKKSASPPIPLLQQIIRKPAASCTSVNLSRGELFPPDYCIYFDTHAETDFALTPICFSPCFRALARST